jgi:hypothetical protein
LKPLIERALLSLLLVGGMTKVGFAQHISEPREKCQRPIGMPSREQQVAEIDTDERRGNLRAGRHSRLAGDVCTADLSR